MEIGDEHDGGVGADAAAQTMSGDSVDAGAVAGCPEGPSQPCPADFEITTTCRMVSVDGGVITISASDPRGYSGGSFHWSTASSKISLSGVNSSSVAVTGLANVSSGRDAEVITVQRTGYDCVAVTKTINITVARVTLGESRHQRCGFRDNGTPTHSDDHVCIKKSDHSFVHVTIEGGLIGTDFNFLSGDTNICSPVAPSAAAQFDLRLNTSSTTELDTSLHVRGRGCASNSFAYVAVHICDPVNHEAEISVNSYNRYFRKYRADGTEHNYSFPKRYKIRIPLNSGGNVLVEVRCKAALGGDVTVAQAHIIKQNLENGISIYWNGKFTLVINDPRCANQSLRIQYRVVWVDSSEDYLVEIHNRYPREGFSGRTLRLASSTSEWTCAHEFGHCIGLPDEYSYVLNSTETVRYIKPDGSLDVAISAPFDGKDPAAPDATIMSSVGITTVLARHGWNIAIEAQQLLRSHLGRNVVCTINR